MKNPKLAELNFRTLLHYNGTPDIRAQSSAPTLSTGDPAKCTGFCVSCEKSGFLESGGARLDQMSHGADTEDFEKAICKLPPGGLDVPVAFLLESPGGYYKNGSPISYEGITKQPPDQHYYWIPRPPISSWPSEVHGAYGPYFAYLIAKHNLRNVYFTNIVKCALAPSGKDTFIPYNPRRGANNRDSKILANCYNLFLSKEMQIVNPRIVFYFGWKAANMGYFAGLQSLLPPPTTHFVKLYHPAARCGLSRIVTENDSRINAALQNGRP